MSKENNNTLKIRAMQETFEEKLESMSLQDLVEWINDYHLDSHMFTFGQIYRTDDEDVWDEISGYLGGYEFARSLSKSVSMNNFTMNAPYFLFDEESNVFTSFSDKEEVIKLFGIDSLEETQINTEE